MGTGAVVAGGWARTGSGGGAALAGRPRESALGFGGRGFVAGPRELSAQIRLGLAGGGGKGELPGRSAPGGAAIATVLLRRLGRPPSLVSWWVGGLADSRAAVPAAAASLHPPTQRGAFGALPWLPLRRGRLIAKGTVARAGPPYELKDTHLTPPITPPSASREEMAPGGRCFSEAGKVE
uniref:Uncharacterized protein n=1 Tax=Sphaerodactylus townsendi TaxID=933632 RepID=A0ACB8G5J6_9SAUR